MSEPRETDDAFALTAVGDDGVSALIEVSGEGYGREAAGGVGRGRPPEPGRYRLRRGGFLARRPEPRIGEERKRA